MRVFKGVNKICYVKSAKKDFISSISFDISEDIDRLEKDMQLIGIVDQIDQTSSDLGDQIDATSGAVLSKTEQTAEEIMGDLEESVEEWGEQMYSDPAIKENAEIVRTLQKRLEDLQKTIKQKLEPILYRGTSDDTCMICEGLI